MKPEKVEKHGCSSLRVTYYIFRKETFWSLKFRFVLVKIQICAGPEGSWGGTNSRDRLMWLTVFWDSLEVVKLILSWVNYWVFPVEIYSQWLHIYRYSTSILPVETPLDFESIAGRVSGQSTQDQWTDCDGEGTIHHKLILFQSSLFTFQTNLQSSLVTVTLRKSQIQVVVMAFPAHGGLAPS